MCFPTRICSLQKIQVKSALKLPLYIGDVKIISYMRAFPIYRVFVFSLCVSKSNSSCEADLEMAGIMVNTFTFVIFREKCVRGVLYCTSCSALSTSSRLMITPSNTAYMFEENSSNSEHFLISSSSAYSFLDGNLALYSG